MSAFDDEENFDEEEDMAQERDLADDAQWKIIQKNTFTRWANEHLKTIDKCLNDLETDLSDGLRLVGLVEVLSGKTFKHKNRRPNFRTQKLENVTMALQFLEEDEGIRIVNIDSGDIVDKKLKLILGLIWTLILHYSISMPMWEGEEPQPSEGGPTPKQRLLNWINSKVPDMPIKNFTTDWNDGKAIGALVDALAPGLCPDWEDWDPKKAKENAKEAMDAAEKWLDVPQLIKPDEMTNPKVDDLSMMTYLSGFPHAKLKPGAPLRPRLNAGKVRAYGPGVEPKGNKVNQPANFTVETFSAGKGELELLVLDPKGKQSPVESKFNKDAKQTYSCVYVPKMEGEYRVIVKFGDKEIQKSPYKVLVEGAAGDPSKVTAAGPGLEKTGVTVQQKTFFEVFTKGQPSKGKGLPGKLPVGGMDAGSGTVGVTILDSKGHRDNIKPTITPSKKEGVYLVEYTALEVGEITITITFNNTAIPKCPYHVTVGGAINPKAVYATGRGIQPKGVRVNQKAEFKVHTKDAGKADVKVQIIGPGGADIKCTVVPSKTEEGVYECLYIPPKVGQYVINITFGGQHITKSPFRVDVAKEKTSKIVAFGPGLESGVVNQPACFTVETNGEVGALGFSIEGPSQAKIDCKDNGDGSADVTYWPTVPGEYAVHILCDEEDIPQAPYMAQIQPATTAFDASKVVAKGPGLEKDGVVVNKPAEFTVDAKKAGKAPLHITCFDINYKPVEVNVKDNKDGTFSCKYTSKTATRHTIIITWGTVGIPKSPFRVNVSEPVNPANVKVYGPGVEKGVKTFVKTYFTVDCRSAGPGDVAISLTDCNGKDVPCNTIDNNDGTFTVEYEPRIPGLYTVTVYFANKEIPKSPIKVKVESSIDLTKVTVKGLEKPIMISEKRTITVVTIKAVKRDAQCTITITMPSGKTLDMQVTSDSEGYSTVFTPTEEGKHTVVITYGGLAVPKSPFTVMVEIAINVSRVVVRGLESPIPLGETRPVYIVTMGLPKKDAPCKVTVTTPKNKTVELPVKQCPEGYTCDFKPTEKGEHKVEVTYDKKPAPDSPYKVDVVEPKQATVQLKGLEEPIEVGEVRPLTVDTSSMPKKDLPCKVTVTSPKKQTVELPLKKGPQGYTTTFTPKEKGPHKVAVVYDNKPIPESPFTTDVLPKGSKPKFVVEVYGLETPVQSGEKRTITIVVKVGDKRAPCKITMTNPKGRTSDLKTKPNPEGYETVFTSWDSGIHKITVEFDGKPVPKSPFEVMVIKVNFAAIIVKGLEKPIPLGETRKVSIITKDCGSPDLPCKVTVTKPDGKKTDLPTTKTPDGYDCDFTPEQPGEHKVTVEYASKEVPKSPFTVHVEVSEITPQKAVKPVESAPTKAEPQKPTQGKPAGGDVTVTGLDTPVNPGEKRPVLIDTTKAPKKGAPCKVTMTNPKGRTSELKTKQVPDGYETTFSSWDKGTHTVTVEYDSKPVPDSPFEVMVEKIDVTKVTVKGLETPIDLGETRPVEILTAATGRPDAPCKVTVINPKGVTKEIPVEKIPEEGYKCNFTPETPGDHKVTIQYAGKEVPNSPFPVKVTTVDISQVTVKGLEKSIMVNERRLIHIITTSTGKKDLPCKVTVTTPKGVVQELFTNKREDGHETVFTPSEIGPHKVKVEVAGLEVPKSEFTVEVTKFELRVTVEGLDTPITAGEKRIINVIAPGPEKPNRFAPPPTCKITVQNPKGRTFEPKMDKTPNGFTTFYTSNEPGEHVFKVEHNGKEIPDSPFTVEVEKLEVRKIEVVGLDTPIEVGEIRPIEIKTAPTGKLRAPIKVTAVGPKGTTTDLPTKETPEGYETSYAPLEVGPHKVQVEFANREVPKSPYPVDVTPKTKGTKEPKVEVKGLETPVTVGEKRPVTVTTDKPDAPCKITQTTPKGLVSEVPIKKIKGGYEATFAPLEEGPHKVKVEQAGKEVPGSPFNVDVKPKIDLGKITVKGLETPVQVGEQRPLTVVTKTCGKPDAPCKVLTVNPKGVTTELPTKKTPEGYETTFAPLEKGPHVVKVLVDDKPVPKSPFSVDVVPKIDLSKVDIKGLEKPVELNEVRPITITTKDTGDENAPCKVTATTPGGRKMSLPTKKVPEGYESTFNPKEKGPHKIQVEVAGKEVPKSPVNVEVVDKLDLKKVAVKGLETPIPLGETRPITVVTAKSGNPDAPCKVYAKGPNEPAFKELPTKKTPEGVECAFTPTQPGNNEVKVVVDDKDLPDSPFSVNVEPAVDLKTVEVKGLESPIEVGEARPITIDTSKTGKPDAPCRVAVMNPQGQTAELPTKKTPQGYETVFAPLIPGPHKVSVDFAGQPVPNSPFPVTVLPKANVGAVTVKGLERPIEVGEPRPIIVDTRSTGRPDAPCSVMVMNPRGQTAELPVRQVPEGYETILNPLEPGPHQVSVNYAGQEVPKSPFPVDVLPRANVGAVSVKGLERPIEVGEPRPIIVDTRSTGRPDAPCSVMVMNPRGQTAELPVRQVPEGYETILNPLEPGPHQVSVNYAGQEVPKSPFPVDVLPKANVGAVTVQGLERPIEVGEPRPIRINTKSTGRPDAPCRVTITNPVGQTGEIPVQPSADGYETIFAPLEPGPHVVNVEFAEQPVPQSPLSVVVTPKPDVMAVAVTGLETPIEVGEARPIQINTASTGKPDAPCKVLVKNPQGQVAELPLQRTPEGYQTVFAPQEPGPHKVDVTFAEKPVPKSPFNVDVKPKVNVGAVEVIGLETPIQVGDPRPVTIVTSNTGKPDAPCKVLVSNPKGQVMELPVRKIPEGYTCTLAPQEEGPHKVNVQFNNQEVPKSPFNVMAETPIDFSKVKVSGLESPVEVGEIRPIQVDTAKCGKVDAPCQVTATNPVGQVRELPLQKTPTGYTAKFAPLEEGPHQVAVKYAGKEVPNSPFKVDAIPQGPASSKVKAYGPGLERGTAEQPCQFTIDTREVTQPGGLGVTVEGPAESKIECRDNQDGTCDVTYYPTVPGDYNINISYADEPIPNSPFTAKVLPSGKFDVSGVKAYGPGLEPGVFLDSPTGFTVDAKSVTPTGDGKVRAIVTNPDGQKTESLVKNNKDGTYDVLYTPTKEGPNTIDVTYEDHPIPNSPFSVNATPGFDASRVRAYGPGLEGGVTNAKQTFTVDVRGAGKGGLALAIDGPAETQINCKDNRDGTCEVEYLPIAKGDYDITVKFADQNIPGSPFNVKVKDEVNPNKVKCYGPGIEPQNVKANEPNTFTVDTKEAGEAPLDVRCTDSKGRVLPAEIVPVAEGVYEATYSPVEEGPCTVDVKYDNHAVPNSPFKVDAKPGIDANKVEITGTGAAPQVYASIPVEYTIDTSKAGPKEIIPESLIHRPDGTIIKPTMQQNPDGTFQCKYTPEDCGPYTINTSYAGRPCKPVKTVAVPIGDASKCTITDQQTTIQVEKQTTITVDASAAGEGKVTCRIRSPEGTEIDIDICENLDGTFSINFTPNFPGDYSICIKFGGQSIPNGEYVVQAVKEEEYNIWLKTQCGDFEEEDLIQAQSADRVDSAAPGQGIYHPQAFRIPIGPIFNLVSGVVEMPSGKKRYPTIEDNKDGTVTVKYQPSEVGLHKLTLCYNQQEIPGSPFQFNVDTIEGKNVTAYGPGLSHGVVGHPAEFTIVTKDAGAGGLSLAIEGPSKTEIKCKDNGDGTCTVSYVPTAPGEYNITVKFADKNISGSPFIAKVIPGEPKQKAMIGRSSEVSLKITETDITTLTASIRSPSGVEEPCMLKRLPNGHLGISFTPRETGEHLVNVYRDGQHIANSPFKITVGETELGNASNVKVYGKGLTEGMANEINEFTVDTREAGYGGLSLSIEGPSKADIECLDNEDGTCRVTYKPTEPGTYIINIKFADEHVPGSPFKVRIGGEASERITERIMRHREAVDVTHVGSECELSLKIPGTSPFDMTASVTSPNGVTELCDVLNLDDCHYSIKFVPKEMGIHTVSVKHKDMHIPGSPFQFTVGPIAGGGAHKVHAAGIGLINGEVHQQNEFNIYTREAGAGGLSIAVEGPSKAEVDFEDRKDGSCGVNYTVSEPGDYMISIKFNDEHIPESPFRVPISPSIGDARKISVSALQNKGLQIGKPAAFTVNYNGAQKGKLQARVVGPSGTEDEALIQEIDDGEFAVRFIPRENGPHLVYVSFDGCQVPDSPFRVQVGTLHADPGMVQAYGEGLRTGKTGQTCKFIVNTCNAGSGALAVTVEGPSKVKLECREVADGYEFSYNPTAPGDYLITIRYAGVNIAGSPYKARIEGQGQSSGYQEQASCVVETVTKTSITSQFASLPPFESDASKVTVEGNGLKKGYRNKSCSFSVDTSRAGQNMLFIGMIGPKGPCEELTVKHIPGAPYKITYLVKERGDYMLAVKLGEDHISGSPFHVRVE